ncbi:MAG: DUF2142 domain-containing protein [Oscillospiraceae bacterium]|nr:DUF2142 domain-containing protein [Oscillospiraceae bacterium]
MKKIRKKHIGILLVLLIPFWLIGISNYFFASTSFVLADGTRQWVGDIDGLLMTLVINLVIIGAWLAGLLTGYLDICITRTVDRILRKKKFIKENPKKILLHIGILFTIVILALIIEVFFSRFASIRDSGFGRLVRLTFYAAVQLSVYCIVVFRNRPEALFVSLSLVIGFLYIIAHPPLWYGWDSGIHYSWAIEESFLVNVSVTRADYLIANTPEFYSFFEYEIYNDLDGFISGRGDYTIFSYLKGTDTFSWLEVQNRTIYDRLAFWPSGLMIFIGRSLTLPPILIVKLSAAANHLLFILLVYLAMKRLTSGKYILAVIAMIPTVFVLSTSQGYDPWVIGFFILSFAYFFHELQNPETKISKISVVIIIGSMFLGLMPKAVYFPLMAVLYFIKKDKFKTQKGYRGYITAVSVAIIVTVLSFAVPYIVSGGGGGGDTRGGSEVNSSLQTMFILENPLAYAGILLRFLFSYVTDLSQNYVTHFAHMKYSSFPLLVWLMIALTMITDRNEKSSLTSGAGLKIVMTFFTFATLALISTSMYILITAVGANNINGVQPRYNIPLLFPFLYIVGSIKSLRGIYLKEYSNAIKTAYSCIVFGCMCFVLFVGVWEKFLPYYV